MINKLPTIYVGYDPKEEAYVHVLKKSIEDNTGMTYNRVCIISFLVVNAGKVLFAKLHQLRCIAGLLDQLLALL